MKRTLYIIFCLISVFASSAQEEDVKVGLVLSGGGAKGLAHIGALQAIEDAGIRIDYIGGTSMGAIVGALYASGYSARELDSIFKVVNFEQLIQDDLPRDAKTFFEKEDAEKYAISLPFDRFKIGFPSSMSRGQNVYNLFYKLTAHVNHISDFSQLPIPFFCMATDVETGQAVQMESGYLPQAMSASSALPSLFSPVTVDNRLLIDGGVVNNYPIDELRQKGMEFIIGVDVQDSLQSRENLKSVISILTQINNYRTINDMRKKRRKTDLYIQPDIKDFSVVSFDKAEEIVWSGKVAAAEFKQELQNLASRQQSPPQEPAEKTVSDILTINQIKMKGRRAYTYSYITGKLKLKRPTETTFQKFSEGINNLSATGNFDQINYHFTPDSLGGQTLHLQLHESVNKVFLRLGVHYDNLYRSAALLNVTHKRLLGKNDVASLDLVLGDNLRYNLDYYIDKGYHWSVGLHSGYNSFRKNVASGFLRPNFVEEPNIFLNTIALEYHELTNRAYVQTLFGQKYLIGLGGEHKKLYWLSKTYGAGDNPTEPTLFENTDYFSLYGQIKADSFDNKYFPSRGFYFDGQFNLYLLAAGLNEDFEEFSIAKGSVGFAFSPINRLALNVFAETGFKIGGLTTQSFDFMLGGYGYKSTHNFVHFLGYDALSLRGDTYLKTSALLRYELFRKNYLTVAGNIANVGDKLFNSVEWVDRIDYKGFGVGYSIDTFVGPLELFYSHSPDRHQSQWYISLGYWF